MIYWDHNAGTTLWPEVAELLVRSARSASAEAHNPSSVHAVGRRARARLDDARGRVARSLHCQAREICFTASGTEAGAMALRGLGSAASPAGRRRVVTTAIEHPALLATLDQLEHEGVEVLRVRPESSGSVSAAQMIASLTPGTTLCSVMWANNETGVLQPVSEIARACRARQIPLHVDAVQTAGRLSISLEQLDVDLLSLSAHKFGGPAGVGVLVARHGALKRPLIPGHQEGGLRGGTVNVGLAEGLALALELAQQSVAHVDKEFRAIREHFESEVLRKIAGTRINGVDEERLANTSNIMFEGVDGEALLIALDLRGICVSSGAACASGSAAPSHVLVAMGLSSRQAQASLRFSLGRGNNIDQVRTVVDALCDAVPKARVAARSLA